MSVSKLDTTQQVKVIKAAAYVGVSALIAYVISAITNNPHLFGALTPLVNVGLVALKQLFTPTSV